MYVNYVNNVRYFLMHVIFFLVKTSIKHLQHSQKGAFLSTAGIPMIQRGVPLTLNSKHGT